jgi:periplasmic protein TonB
MPRDLFGAISRPPATAGSHSRVTVPLSMGAHAVALLALAVIPLVATDTLPVPRRFVTMVVVKPVIPPEPPRPTPPARADVTPPLDPAIAPVTAPSGITNESPRVIDTGALDAAPASDIIAGIGTVAVRDEPPPPPPQPLRVRVGGTVTAPTRSIYVPPTYPPIAVAARRQGVVIIQATIGIDGRVTDAQVLRSEPLLDQSALEAVRQWRYTPTLLNGEPVEVVMTVTVSFVLGRE